MNTVYVMQIFDRDEAHLDRVTLVGVLVSQSSGICLSPLDE